MSIFSKSKLFFQSFFQAKIFNNFKINKFYVNDPKKLNFSNKKNSEYDFEYLYRVKVKSSRDSRADSANF